MHTVAADGVMEKAGTIRSLSWLAVVIALLGYSCTGAVTCDVPSPPLNGSVNVDANVTTASFWCGTLFEVVGTGVITCDPLTGLWSAAEPTCNLKTCGSLSDDNGVWTYGSRNYGSTAQLACNSGYTIRKESQPYDYLIYSNIANVTCVCCTYYYQNVYWTKKYYCSRLRCPRPTLYHGRESYSYRYLNDTVNYSCNPGYEMTSGDATRTCLDTGDLYSNSWSGTQPVCTGLDCGPPPNPTHGSVSASSTKYPNHAFYSCNTGYVIVGDSSRQCNRSGLWEGTAPTCQIVDCGANLSAPTYGSVDVTLTTYGEEAVFTCDVGFYVNGAGVLTCNETGDWRPSAPTCDIVDCGVPPSIALATFTYDFTVYGGGCVYTCVWGYEVSSGDTTRTCEASGLWSGTEPVCSVLDCGPPVQIMNGGVSAPATMYGDNATYHCNTGYVMQGVAVRTCDGGGQWSGTMPTCLVVDCGAPLAPSNGSMDMGIWSSIVYVIFTCDIGFYINGATLIKCTDSDVWDPPVPTCDPVDCGALAVPTDGSVSTPDGTFYPGKAYYACDTGYIMSGPSVRGCQADGTWNDTAPNCSIADCGTPPSITAHGNASYVMTTFAAIVEYTCEEGFELNGVSVMSCNASGHWNDTAPSCDITECHALRTFPTVSHYQTVTSSLPGFTFFSTSAASSALHCIATCNAHARHICDTGLAACGLVTYDDVTQKCNRFYSDMFSGTVIGCDDARICYRK